MRTKAEPTQAQENAATIAAIPTEYISEQDRAVYVARALADEDVYSYCNATRWVIWDGAILDADRRVVFERHPDMACTCCGAGEWLCECGAWRCDHCGRCLVTGHCLCWREGEAA